MNCGVPEKLLVWIIGAAKRPQFYFQMVRTYVDNLGGCLEGEQDGCNYL